MFSCVAKMRVITWSGRAGKDNLLFIELYVLSSSRGLSLPGFTAALLKFGTSFFAGLAAQS